MALSLDNVKEKFFGYSGEDPEDSGPRGDLCAQICGECFAWVKSRILDEESLGAEKLAALESWAAALALYQLALRDEAVSPEAVTADGVRVNRKESSLRARALMEEKRREAAPVLGEEAFYFGSIRHD